MVLITTCGMTMYFPKVNIQACEVFLTETHQVLVIVKVMIYFYLILLCPVCLHLARKLKHYCESCTSQNLLLLNTIHSTNCSALLTHNISFQNH